MLPRRTRALTVALLTTSMLVFSACGGDDPTGTTGDALTAAEAQYLVSAFFGSLQLIQIPLLETGPAAVAGGPARTPYGEVYDDQIDATDTCLGGGQTTVDGIITGDVDQAAGTADITATATVDFVNCVVPGETVTFTVNGDPDVGIVGDIVITDQAITIDIDASGGVAFETSDGRSGTCGMDITISANASQAGLEQTLTGSACGQNASQFDLVLFD